VQRYDKGLKKSKKMKGFYAIQVKRKTFYVVDNECFATKKIIFLNFGARGAVFFSQAVAEVLPFAFLIWIAAMRSRRRNAACRRPCFFQNQTKEGIGDKMSDCSLPGALSPI
jgi:hypothetical protein